MPASPVPLSWPVKKPSKLPIRAWLLRSSLATNRPPGGRVCGRNALREVWRLWKGVLARAHSSVRSDMSIAQPVLAPNKLVCPECLASGWKNFRMSASIIQWMWPLISDPHATTVPSARNARLTSQLQATATALVKSGGTSVLFHSGGRLVGPPQGMTFGPVRTSSSWNS